MIALPFISCSMVILHNGSFYWLLDIAISIFFLALLVDSISFIIITLTGLILSCIAVQFYIGYLNFNPTGYEALVGLYMVTSSIIFGTFFSRNREDFVKEKLEVLRAMGGTIAHELTTPLASISLYSHIIDSSNDKTLKDTKLKDSSVQFQTIKESAQAIESIIRSTFLIIDMLLTNMKDPSQESNKANYFIKQLVEDSIAHYPLTAQQKKLVNLNLEDDFEFFGNETMFSHIIYNLVKNSIYYIRQAGKGEIVITTEKSMLYNKLYFRDMGKGIPAEMLPHMFEKFYTKTNKGTGLGLAFCKQVMEDLGGKISCYSVYGQYIEFVLEFPAIPPTNS
jgi:signal transduction histidine kinase